MYMYPHMVTIRPTHGWAHSLHPTQLKLICMLIRVMAYSLSGHCHKLLLPYTTLHSAALSMRPCAGSPTAVLALQKALLSEEGRVHVSIVELS